MENEYRKGQELTMSDVGVLLEKLASQIEFPPVMGYSRCLNSDQS